jgi:ATP-dependent helicase HrpA
LGHVSGQRIPPSAFQEEKVPEELRMNLRVVDSTGQTLAAGRDVAWVRQRLGQEAAASIAALADPRWTRDHITQWDFGELPEEVEIRRGGLAVKAFPMLVDAPEGVALRLADTSERAIRQTRSALRRLFLSAAGRELKSQAQWLPNRQAMELHGRTLDGFKFVERVAELIAERAAAADTPIPRSKAEFEGFVAAARQRIGLAVQDVAGLLGPLLEAYHQARLALEQARSPRWQYALDDILAQLDRLTPPRFLILTPWHWLAHFPRYLRAISVRLDAVRGGGLARDREHCEEIQRRWQAYAERAAEHERFGIDDPELVRFRWMLEEFRVSLFAQRLGTSLPVSAKRLDQQWNNVRPG